MNNYLSFVVDKKGKIKRKFDRVHIIMKMVITKAELTFEEVMV
jgi:hypothetical protein